MTVIGYIRPDGTGYTQSYDAVRLANPNVSLFDRASDVPDVALANMPVPYERVYETARPSDPLITSVSEGEPEKVNGVWLQTWVTETVTEAGYCAATLVADLKAIDEAGEACRNRWVTPGSGQAMTYLRKEEQARAFIAAGRPSDASAYPFLVAEATATSQTVSDLADAIVTAADAWANVIGPGIEALRIGAKKARNAATTLAERDAALAIAWPTP